MEYERIQKAATQGEAGGGVSPSKLRLMLLGVERWRKEEEEEQEGEELEPKFSLRSNETRVVEDRKDITSPDSCKDVDIVTSPPECSTSSRAKNRSFVNPRGSRSQELEGMDPDNIPSSAFEFQRAERASHRPSKVPPFSKTAPSKWDDAQKWIASPASSRNGKAGPLGKRGGSLNYGSRMATTKVVMEVVAEPDTKMIDVSLVKKEGGGMKNANRIPDTHPVVDTCTKSPVFLEDAAINLSQHDSSMSGQSATAFVHPPPTVRSVSMRDMGTEMTPIASQEPSRSGTPVGASTPIRSPTQSRPSSPGRMAPSSSPVEFSDCHGDPNRKELSEKELHMKTRREIMILGTKLGKPNIAAWASREEEEQDASTSLKNVTTDHPEKNTIETRASAWEEAEKAKYLARFKREEIKIQAWENHQKAKAEAEMRKTEVEAERIKVRAHEKLKDKLATIRQRAEEKRMSAEAKRNKQAAQTAEQVDYILRTGKMPLPSSCWGWCSWD